MREEQHPDEFMPPRRRGGAPRLRRWWQRMRAMMPATPRWSPDWDRLAALVLPGSMQWRAGRRDMAVGVLTGWALLVLTGWWLRGTPAELPPMTAALLGHIFFARKALFGTKSTRLGRVVIVAVITVLYTAGWYSVSSPAFEIQYAMRDMLPAPLVQLNDRVILAADGYPVGSLVMFMPGQALEIERGRLYFYGQTFGRVVAPPGSADADLLAAALEPCSAEAAAPLRLTDRLLADIRRRLPLRDDVMLVLVLVGTGTRENDLRTTLTILTVPVDAVTGRVERIVWPWPRRRVL